MSALTRSGRALRRMAKTQLANAQRMVQNAADLRCQTQEDADLVGEKLVWIRTYKADSEKARKAATKPFWDRWQLELARFRPATQLLDQADKVLCGLLRDWNATVEAVRAKALKEAALTGDQSLVEHAPRGAPAVLDTRHTWEFAIEDVSKVPEKYTMRVVDTPKVMSAINAGVRQIPGLRIFQESSFRRKPGRKKS